MVYPGYTSERSSCGGRIFKSLRKKQAARKRKNAAAAFARNPCWYNAGEINAPVARAYKQAATVKPIKGALAFGMISAMTGRLLLITNSEVRESRNKPIKAPAILLPVQGRSSAMRLFTTNPILMALLFLRRSIIVAVSTSTLMSASPINAEAAPGRQCVNRTNPPAKPFDQQPI